MHSMALGIKDHEHIDKEKYEPVTGLPCPKSYQDSRRSTRHVPAVETFSSRDQTQRRDRNGCCIKRWTLGICPFGPTAYVQSSSLRSLFNRRREHTTDHDVPLEPQSKYISPVSPEISKLALAFVNILNTSQVSGFFAWFLHFDAVEPPESFAAWYAHIDTMEMRGWIALGLYLSETIVLGIDTVVLDSICDRLGLRRRTMHNCIVQLNTAKSKLSYKTGVDRVEFVQARLHDLHLVAKRITLTRGSIFEYWRIEAEKRLRGYLTEVIGKRIEHHKMGVPLMRQMDCTQISKDIQAALHLNYLYEAMHEERQLPLVRYGLFPDSPKALTPPESTHGEDRVVPVVWNSFVATECQLERSFSLTKTRSENTYFRDENEQLRRNNEALIDSNEQLVRKIAALGRIEPTLFTRPDWNPFVGDSTESPSRRHSSLLQVPRQRQRPRSLSEGAAQDYSAMLVQKLNVALVATANLTLLSSNPIDATTLDLSAKLKRGHTTAAAYPTPRSSIRPAPELPLSARYQDVFAALDEKPLPALSLLHPGTGEPLTLLPPPCPAFRLPRMASGIELQTPDTRTLAGGEMRRRSTRGPPATPITPNARNSTRRSMLMSEASFTAPSQNNPYSMLATPDTSTLALCSNWNARSDASRYTTESIPPVPLLPGPYNSLVGYYAQSINQNSIQRPITSYAGAPSPLVMVKGRMESMARRQDC
ncbi:hypothetical protein K458DRAFT_393703 [Lentithecium fluviatile CBS 122367]|uniref:Uncharacterized protein n=1 Tax=Lentithecium fluviatile CBS 122367 TaxID=1168545 RepID=A0A6G1IMV0_9PLEO|nr:hypothetical protein K458DRAFT_393703 [Lentithecium fluviatile CBS 122367]